MKFELDTLIGDYSEMSLPSLIHRDIHVPRAQGNALVVIGIRRTGKTWFCFQMMQDLLKKGVSRDQILYINFEDERLMNFKVDDFQTLLEAFFRRNPSAIDNEVHYFFDEIQQVYHWPRFIRRLLDMGNANVTITGSSAKMLSSEIHSSLRGRALTCEVFPFSLEEYLRSKEMSVPKINPSTKEKIKLEHFCDEYLNYGGFPGLMGLDPRTHRQMLQQYIDVVILRDVVERHNVGSVTTLRTFLRHILHSPSTRLSINKVYNDFKSRGLKCSKNGLHSFLDYLEDAYLIYTVPIHSRSERVRQVNPKKIYVIDTGLLSAASLNLTRDQGALLENLVYIALRRKGYVIEYFYDTNEIKTDFIVRDAVSGEILHLIQVCWTISSSKTRDRELRGLNSAMNQLNIAKGTIVTWRDESSLIDNPDIKVIPFWKLQNLL